MINYIRIILCFMVGLASLHSIAQKDTIVDGVSYNLISKFPDGQIHELGNLKMVGKRQVMEGPWIVYTSDGGLLEKGSYFEGGKTGPWSERGIHGGCCWTGEYVKGKKSGEWWNGASLKITYKKGKKRSQQYIHFEDQGI